MQVFPFPQLGQGAANTDLDFPVLSGHLQRWQMAWRGSVCHEPQVVWECLLILALSPTDLETPLPSRVLTC